VRLQCLRAENRAWLTQHQWRRQRVQNMWLQPPFFWVGAPQPLQGFVLCTIQVSLRLAASFFMAAIRTSHSLTCNHHNEAPCYLSSPGELSCEPLHSCTQAKRSYTARKLSTQKKF
jgi:hypothetical protein